ncbi:Uncharacterised protein [Mycobacteroides abscessus subsp. abscessus]|nr:Uncharacterised protein [Mycobacteroides abscessus subsp. abscessus]
MASRVNISNASAICPAAAEVMRSPGATRSGLVRPSKVGPFDESYVTPLVCGRER